jgi:hypothetical protein
MSQSRACSPKEFRERNNISNTTLYKEIKSGRLVALKVGRRTIITAEAETNWLAALPKLRLAAANDAAAPAKPDKGEVPHDR